MSQSLGVMKYLFTCRSHFTMAGLPFSWSSRHLRPLASTRTLTRQAFGQRSLSSLLCKFLASCMPSVCHTHFLPTQLFPGRHSSNLFLLLSGRRSSWLHCHGLVPLGSLCSPNVKRLYSLVCTRLCYPRTHLGSQIHMESHNEGKGRFA